jgi:hypothetical protein
MESGCRDEAMREADAAGFAGTVLLHRDGVPAKQDTAQIRWTVLPRCSQGTPIQDSCLLRTRSATGVPLPEFIGALPLLEREDEVYLGWDIE